MAKAAFDFKHSAAAPPFALFEGGNHAPERSSVQVEQAFTPALWSKHLLLASATEVHQLEVPQGRAPPVYAVRE